MQRTGDMFYLYLPTRWCKKFGISSASKVGVQVNADSSLNIYPQARSEKPTHLTLKVDGTDLESLHKLIVACYISPADSFRISLDREIDFTKLLDQKNLVSLELVEIDGKQITCESSLHVSDPLSLLVTMIRKIKNLLHVVSKSAPRGLVERYEEEIDRSKLLIEKSVISSLVNPTKSSHKAIELHFISLITTGLERIADHLIIMKKLSSPFVARLSALFLDLGSLLKDNTASLTPHSALDFLHSLQAMPSPAGNDSYEVQRAIRALNSISEVIVDWAVVKEAEQKSI